MKNLIIIAFALALSFAVKTSSAQDVNFGFFYSSLAPYGNWIELDNGVTVWRPTHMRYGWAPYRYGHWVWTDDGWYWDSDDPFGYIVFHYGRWYNDDYYGWIWVPDYDWAPSWVEWRYDNDYIGWAPLPPYANFSISLGIHFTTGYYTPYNYWSFVGYRHMYDPYVYRYYVPDREKYRIYSVTKYRTNYGYSDGRIINRGVDVDYVRQRSGQRIVERQIERVNDPKEIRNMGNRNSNNVRALILPKDQIDRARNNNFQIIRSNRPSSMDVSRIEIGRNRGERQNNAPEINSYNQKRNEPGRDAIIQQRPNVNPDINRRETPYRIEKNGNNNREQNQRQFDRSKLPEKQPVQNDRRNLRVEKQQPPPRQEVRRESPGKNNLQPKREAGNNRRESNDRRGR